MAELMALEKFLEILILHRSTNVIIEANSEITINSVKRISCGTKPEKVSNHWRLIQVYQRIQAHLQGLHTVSFSHVHQNANKLADILANQGVNNADRGMEKKSEEMSQNRLKELCDKQAEEDDEVDRNHGRGSSTNGFFLARVSSAS